jgi:hypothetical protein
MKNVIVNGVNIRVHGDASVSVDSYGNVDVYVKPTYVNVSTHNLPWIRQKPYIQNPPVKHWLK